MHHRVHAPPLAPYPQSPPLRWSWTALLVLMPCWLLLSVPARPYANPDSSKEAAQKTKPENASLLGTVGSLLQPHKMTLLGEPHLFSVWPIGYYTPRTGINLGFQATLTANARRPYRYQLILQFIASLKGNHKHQLLFHYPRIGDSPFGLFIRGYWERDLEARYFGLGDGPLPMPRSDDADTHEPVDDDFYFYTLKRPRFAIHALYEFLPGVHFWLGFDLHFVDPQFDRAPAVSFLAEDRPFGHLGGYGGHLSVRLRVDTRNHPVFPTWGVLAEVTVQPNLAYVEMPTAGKKKVTFQRYTFSTAHFWPMAADRLVLANRLAFEAVDGQAPYYAYLEIGDSLATRSLGGSQSLRGYESRRFLDRLKLFTLTELRFKVHTFSIINNPCAVVLTAFLDNGRVWSDWSSVALDDFRTTYGGGIWLEWDETVIVRLDLGHSDEDTIVYARMGTAF